MRTVILAFVLALLSTAVVSGSVRLVVAQEKIYFRSDGSVDPPTAPIQRDGNIYTFTDNIYDEIVVERDNIVVDGAGYTLQGKRAYYSKGIYLTGRSNVTIRNVEIKTFFFGIWLEKSSNNSIFENKITNNKGGIWLSDSSNHNSISENNVTANLNYGIYIGHSSSNSISTNSVAATIYYGICLEHSSSNNISGNNITNNDYGIKLSLSSNKNNAYGNSIKNNLYGILLWKSSGNAIYGNDIANNDRGIALTKSSDNIIYHNNFMDNTEQAYSYNSTNVWDNGHPFGGNYWSHYTGEDRNGDSIGDTSYVIDQNNQDNYPLMIPWNPTWSPKPPVEIPFWSQWWFWAIAVIGIVVLAGAAYFLRGALKNKGMWRFTGDISTYRGFESHPPHHLPNPSHFTGGFIWAS